MLKQIIVVGCILMTNSVHAQAVATPKYQKNSETIVARAYDEMARDELFSALTSFEKALVANPSSQAAYMGLGQVHHKLGNLDIALKYLDTALLVDPGHLELLYYKGMVLIDLSDEGAAKAVLDKMRFICGDKPCENADKLEQSLTVALQKKVAEMQKP